MAIEHTCADCHRTYSTTKNGGTATYCLNCYMGRRRRATHRVVRERNPRTVPIQIWWTEAEADEIGKLFTVAERAAWIRDVVLSELKYLGRRKLIMGGGAHGTVEKAKL